MPASAMKLSSLTAALALFSVSALAQTSGDYVFPRLLVEPERVAPWLRATEHSTWVPVFMLGDSDGDGRIDPFSPDPVGGVLLGLAHVRSSSAGFDTAQSFSPTLSWRAGENLRLGASMTVTEFIPCRSLLEQPLAPLRFDSACESFASQSEVSERAVAVNGSIQFGSTQLSVGYSEAPAIYVLPSGPISFPQFEGELPAVVPGIAPGLGILAGETVQTFGIGGNISLSEESRIGVALALSQMPRLENSPDIGRMQLSWAYGSFSADMATQMIRQGLESVSPWWAGMDLGLTWRTPWSGVISLGARNLVSSGDPPRFNDPRAKEPSEADVFSRTPYVRYEQDF